MFSPKYEAMVGMKGGKDWGINEVGMKQMDDNIGCRAQEARRHGPARQHDRRVHHGQRRRDDHLPRRRRHAVQGGQADHLGRRHARSVRHPLAGRDQAGHGLQGDVLRARLAADTGRNRRRSQGQRAEQADQAGSYKGIVKTKLDGVNQLDYLTGKSQKSAARHVLLLHGCDSLGRALQELEVLLHDARRNGHGRPAAARALQVDADPEHQARSVRTERGHGPEELDGDPGRTGRPVLGVSLRLEPFADWPGALGEGTHVVQGIPTAAAGGELQPRTGSPRR